MYGRNCDKYFSISAFERKKAAFSTNSSQQMRVHLFTLTQFARVNFSNEFLKIGVAYLFIMRFTYMLATVC